tara:strand:- start:7214 stop:7447 length:234 start_codon:yes stop_codon:yes gene_type:complete
MPTRFVEVPPGFTLGDLGEIPTINFTLPALNLTLRQPKLPEGPALYAMLASVVLFFVNVVMSRVMAKRALDRFGKSE